MLFFDINLEGLFFLESHTFYPYKSKLKGLLWFHKQILCRLDNFILLFYQFIWGKQNKQNLGLAPHTSIKAAIAVLLEPPFSFKLVIASIISLSKLYKVNREKHILSRYT